MSMRMHSRDSPKPCEPNMKALHQTLADLIRINSVNAFYQDGPGEAVAAQYIEDFFCTRGISTFKQLVFQANGKTAERSNVIAKLPGLDPNRRLILEAHMDTVSVRGMNIDPFDPKVQHGNMFGRGACDTKGGLAAMMHAMADLRASGIQPECEVWLAAVVDEEHSFEGVTKLCQELRKEPAIIASAIVAEPTELRVAIASKGVLRWRIHAIGLSAHSSKVHLGRNAITHMARFVLAIEQEQSRLQLQSHPLLGTASINVGRIDGGVQVNFVPDSCSIEIDRRMLPGESTDDILEYTQKVLDGLQMEYPEMEFRMESPMLVDEPWTADVSHPSVSRSSQVLQSMGLNPQPIGVSFGSDASKLERAGIATVIFGPGSIDLAHTANEHVPLDRAFEFYRTFIETYLCLI
jgi:acetylornithine deacetylase/succinyl-diaminopimelate desuccinylase family protein